MTGPVRYTMTAEGAVELISALPALPALRLRVAVPVHYEGWSHFDEPAVRAREVLQASAVCDRIRWLTRGVGETV